MTFNNSPEGSRHVPWLRLAGACLLVLVVGFAIYFFATRTAPTPEAVSGLSPEVQEAYVEAHELAAVYGDYQSAVARLDIELDAIPVNSQAPNDLYARAKIAIYKADIYLVYGPRYAEGFAILSEVYGEPRFDARVRSEALMLAMAHTFQALDEGALTLAEIRDFVLLDPYFAPILGVDLADVMLLDEPIEVYPYLAQGFAAVMDMTPSEKVFVLAESYAMRLSSPFVVPPPTGGYYYDFVASAGRFESEMDALVTNYQSISLPYQDFVGTSYYNLARAYEGLPHADVNIVDSMIRIYEKLAAYAAAHTEIAYGADAYLSGLDTRIVCKAVDEAEFDVSRIDVSKIQPHLDSLAGTDGWVIPCGEAFELIANEIDPRFAVFFEEDSTVAVE